MMINKKGKLITKKVNLSILKLVCQKGKLLPKR